jgi:hypothetical protein
MTNDRLTNVAPRARTAGLLVEKVGEETVVFDRSSKKALRLNRSAALVWGRCDGNTSIEDLAGIVQRELNLNESAEPLVEMALQQLGSMKLLEGHSGITRRRMGSALAAAAALIPVVVAITVPTPAMAASGSGSEGKRPPEFD